MYMRYYDDHIEVEIKDFIDKINDLLGINVKNKIRGKEYKNHVDKSSVSEGCKMYAKDDMFHVLCKYKYLCDCVRIDSELNVGSCLGANLNVQICTNFENENVDLGSNEFSVLGSNEFRFKVPEIFQFDDNLKEDVLRNILNYVNLSNKDRHCCIMKLIKFVNPSRTIIKKMLRDGNDLFKGKLIVFDNVVNMFEDVGVANIGVKDQFMKNVSAFFPLNLKGLGKKGRECQKTFLNVENTCKEIEIDFEYERSEPDFLNVRFTTWCINNIGCSIIDIHSYFMLYSIATNLSLSKICKYFIELQVKTFIVNDDINNHVILSNLMFFNDNFPDENMCDLIDTSIYYIREKICNFKFNKNNGDGYINLYDSVIWLKLIYKTKNEKLTKPINIYKEFLQYKEELCVHFTDEIINYDHTNIKDYLEHICSNLETVYRKKLDVLLLIKGKIRIIEKNINRAMFHQKNIEKYVIIILACIKKIEKYTHLKMKICYDIIESYIQLISNEIRSEFIYTLKLIINNKYEEEITENEISCLYDVLKFFITKSGISEVPFIKQINAIHISNLTKLARKRKNLDSYRINLLNSNHISFSNLSKLAVNNDYELHRLDYLCMENKELTASILFYKNKIKDLTETEFEVALEHVLDKATQLCDRLYLSFKFNLYNQVVDEKKHIKDINEIGELFCLKSNDREYHIR